jgi:hypothetical protein
VYEILGTLQRPDQIIYYEITCNYWYLHLNKLKVKQKNVLLPHEAIVSRWKAVFLLRGYNRRGEKYYYCFVNKTRVKQKDGKDHA